MMRALRGGKSGALGAAIVVVVVVVVVRKFGLVLGELIQVAVGVWLRRCSKRWLVVMEKRRRSSPDGRQIDEDQGLLLYDNGGGGLPIAFGEVVGIITLLTPAGRSASVVQGRSRCRAAL